MIFKMNILFEYTCFDSMFGCCGRDRIDSRSDSGSLVGGAKLSESEQNYNNSNNNKLLVIYNIIINYYIN